MKRLIIIALLQVDSSESNETINYRHADDAQSHDQDQESHEQYEPSGESGSVYEYVPSGAGLPEDEPSVNLETVQPPRPTFIPR